MRSEADTDLSALAHEVAARLGVVGAQVAVLRGGRVREGVAGIESGRTCSPVVPETLFQVGSTTKVHTACLVMQLVEEGRVGLDAPVVEQLPGFRLPDRAATASLTPRHLMSMSSGIDNGPYSDHGRGDGALRRYVEALADLPLQSAPGELFGYSNASTCVSGRLVEHVTGTTWEQALSERVLDPCGLRDSAILPEDVMWRRFAVGAVADGEPVRGWTLPRALSPAGALCSSAGDLVRFAALFLHGGVPSTGHRVLGASSVAQMQERAVDVPPTLLAQWWGLGPYGRSWDGVDVVGHSGSSLGGSSYLLWVPGRDVAVATTVNSPHLGYRFADEVFRALFRVEAGVAVPPPVVPPAHVDVDEERLLGSYRMASATFTVDRDADGLVLTGTSDVPGGRGVAPCRLVPLTPTTFLPADSAVSGGRGWALAFLGDPGRPATHLLNGFFAMRRLPA